MGGRFKEGEIILESEKLRQIGQVLTSHGFTLVYSTPPGNNIHEHAVFQLPGSEANIEVTSNLNFFACDEEKKPITEKHDFETMLQQNRIPAALNPEGKYELAMHVDIKTADYIPVLTFDFEHLTIEINTVAQPV